MYKSMITAAVLALGISITPAQAAEQAAQPEQQQPEISNPLDPSAWIGGLTGQGDGSAINWFDLSAWSADSTKAVPVTFNAAHPASWAKFFDPATHGSMHIAFSNPATYAQFMTPQFYMQFMNPSNWVAWMNPANYSVFMNPASYTYWMNPMAYMHVMDMNSYAQVIEPTNYTAFIDPATYMQWVNPSAYAIPGIDLAAIGDLNWSDPSSWGNIFQSQPAQEEATQ
ncbi:hypothetical protein N9H39_09900 [Gammaproteobacteria bacterium]|nr:hypothetical protein [Gammaproteobacteria bacterium]